MTAQVQLPRMLSDSVGTDRFHHVHGSTVGEALSTLFQGEPGLRNHIIDEHGEIRPHVLVFVDGKQAGLGTSVRGESKIRVLHAVSGGSS